MNFYTDNQELNLILNTIQKQTKDREQRENMLSQAVIEYHKIAVNQRLSEVGNVVALVIATASIEVGNQGRSCGVRSMDEVDSEGRLAFDVPAAVVDDDEDLESQLTPEIQEVMDVLRVEGMEGLARKWGCKLRNAYYRFDRMCEEFSNINKGLQVQGDLFGGAA